MCRLVCALVFCADFIYITSLGSDTGIFLGYMRDVLIHLWTVCCKRVMFTCWCLKFIENSSVLRFRSQTITWICIHTCFRSFKDTKGFSLPFYVNFQYKTDWSKRGLKSVRVDATTTEDVGARFTDKMEKAMECEISGRPSITISNLRFNQSGRPSEARPACCAEERLSHRPPVPQETNAGEHQQLKAL